MVEAPRRWLFSPAVDAAIFGGPAVLTLVVVAIAVPSGFAYEQTPPWAWLLFVLGVDVAHVYGTVFRVYADGRELRRRPALYAAAPAVALAAGVLAYAHGSATFWRLLAYVATWHFVRQQMGFMALYRGHAGDRRASAKWLDTLAIGVATGCPLVYWHSHLPRDFAWMLPGDFVALPPVDARLLWGTWGVGLGAYALRSAGDWRCGRGVPGSDLVLASTGFCWFVGIVAVDSDFVFTVSNVLLHGVPYAALVYAYGDSQRASAPARRLWQLFDGGPAKFLAALWVLAFAEELLWDRAVWHEQPQLFGAPWTAARWHGVLVPLLAVPQLTHYLLDAFVWRRADNPALARLFKSRQPLA